MKLASLVAVLAFFVLIGGYITTHRVEIPAAGGSYTEALIGEPRFINPLYASTNDVDTDLSKLIYSSLLKWDSKDGLVNDLATSLLISEDGTEYTITIRDDAKFHNGEKVRASDVVFTYTAAKNPAFRSPLISTLRNAEITQVDEYTVSFKIEEPFTPFAQVLTLGILPAGIWGDIAPANASLAALNLEPVGSGLYKFVEFTKDKKGNVQSYTLKRNTDYYKEEAKIEELTFKFYQDSIDAVRALENKNVEGISFVPFEKVTDVENLRSTQMVYPKILREVVIYFNDDMHAALKKSAVREALTLSVDKWEIIEKALNGHATPIKAPILEGMTGYHTGIEAISKDLEKANSLLKNAGFPKSGVTETSIANDELVTESDTSEDEDVSSAEEAATNENTETVDEETITELKEGERDLRFTLTTVESPEFIEVAELIKSQFKAVGVTIDIELVPTDQFYSTVLEPKAFELLLTGILLGADPDPYAFWHSSQIDSGLNLASYKNKIIDTLIEEARKTTNEEERSEKYKKFQELLIEDFPAIFLYQSTYAYAIPTKIKNLQIESLTKPSDRFANISDWYIKTKKALK